jgi:hypothetical protein
MPRYDERKLEERKKFWKNFNPNKHGFTPHTLLSGIEPYRYTYWEGEVARAKEMFEDKLLHVVHMMEAGHGMCDLKMLDNLREMQTTLIQINQACVNIQQERQGMMDHGDNQTVWAKGDKMLPENMRK